MSEEEKPFTVKDRRHFTAEGDARAPEATATAEAPVEPPAPTTAVPPEPPPAQLEADDPQEDDHAQGQLPPLDFAGLLLSLGAQAGYLLQPGEGQPPDLAAARSLISLLEILKTKTEGRRTPDEDRVLEGLLYELRLAYVARSGRGPGGLGGKP